MVAAIGPLAPAAPASSSDITSAADNSAILVSTFKEPIGTIPTPG